MRVALFALAFAGIAGVSLALADPPPPAQSQPATTTATSAAPHAPQAAAPDAAAKPLVDPREQRLLSLGYKPVTRNGEKLFCKRETVLGSRLGSVERCGTVEHLTEEARVSHDQIDSVQRTQVNPSGH